MTNTQTRVAVAAVAIPCILALDWLGGYFWFLFVAALLVLGLREFFLLAGAKGAKPQRGASIAAALLIAACFLHDRLERDAARLFAPQGMPFPTLWQALVIAAILFLLWTFLRELYRGDGSPILNTGATLLGVFYIGLFGGTAVGMREIFSTVEFPVGRYFGGVALDAAQRAQLDAWGAATVASILAAIWLCDTAAYFAGRAFGTRKLFPRVSPAKTWEGAIAGGIAAVGTMLLAKHFLLGYLETGHAIALGAIVGLFGQMGDLVESLIKRDAEAKDSSALIPGHGGVLDRFDSFLFVSPIIFLYLDFIVFA